jgi:hypothetical protein
MTFIVKAVSSSTAVLSLVWPVSQLELHFKGVFFYHENSVQLLHLSF